MLGLSDLKKALMPDDATPDAAADDQAVQKRIAQNNEVKKAAVPQYIQAPQQTLDWFTRLQTGQPDEPLIATMPPPEMQNVISGLSLPQVASPQGHFNDLRLCGPNASLTHTNRQAPASVNALLREGDVIYFGGGGANHAEQVVGKTADGKAIFCSDTNQGTNFYVNDACQHGDFVIYRPSASFDVKRASANLLAHAEAGYTGNCAKYVREFGEDAGLQGTQIQRQPSTAAGYVSNGSSLTNAGYTQIAEGNASELRVSPSLMASTQVAPKNSRPTV